MLLQNIFIKKTDGHFIKECHNFNRNIESISSVIITMTKNQLHAEEIITTIKNKTIQKS